MILAAWLLAFLGVATIAMSNQASSRIVTGLAVPTKRRHRSTIWGSATLLLSLSVTIANDGLGLGLLLSPLLIASATAAVIVLLMISPRHLRPIAQLLDR
ncbi:hypothetical protein ASE90_17030 [Sphingomonas sp. Leaf67]|uniref:DUF3325 family protein n=1 Tax=Sphingomonas sp. Leaf67 TaxID=1736230 RepID=UPI0006FC5E96|nr:DUF3325 family protein [Sphingomonas sp. Leaf67]KQN90789.1 hypothetical protein ASE90_17030 [Sphingomonas sp. Leaf67]